MPPNEHDNTEFLASVARANKGLKDTREFIGEQLTDPLNYVGAGAGKVGKLIGKGLLAATGALKGTEADAMMYGGKWIPPSIVQRLEELVKTGKMSSNALFKKTGYFQDSLGEWKRYSPDNDAVINKDELSKLSMFDSKRLGDVLQHHELYKTSPELAEIPVKNTNIWAAMNNVTGSFDPKTMAMTVSKNQTPEAALNTILHEIQHWVQTKGGVSNGANVHTMLPEKLSSAEKISSDVYKNLRSRISLAGKKYPGVNLFNFQEVANPEIIPEVMRKYSASTKLHSTLPEEAKKELQSLSREYADYKKLQSKLSSLRNAAFNKYKNNPGEVEARVTGSNAGVDLRTKAEHPSFAYEKEISDPELYFDPNNLFPLTIK